MSKEDTGFFPEAERVLEPAIFGELEAQITDPSDPLFDQKAADRLAKLRAHLGDLP
jgi:hypothetical protein